MLVTSHFMTILEEERMTPAQMKAIDRYEKLSRDIRHEEKFIQVCREMANEKQRVGGSWLGFFAIFLGATLLFSSLILNMGRLFGWWTIDQFDALLEALKATLLGLGGGEGPLHLVGTAVWGVIELVCAVLIALPLELFKFIEILIPDAETIMGFVDGAILLVVFGLLIRANPLAKVPKLSSLEQGVVMNEMRKSQARLEGLERQRKELVESAGIQDYASKQ